MAHAVRQHLVDPPPSARIACVLALLYPKADDWHIVFIERESSNPNDRHGGQISFPGGKQDATDPSLEYTALREAHEEVGIHPPDVTVLGQISPLYISVSNFHVFPFLGYMTKTPEFIPQEGEVRSILEVPFSHFRQPDIIQHTHINLSPHLTLRNVPYYNLGGRVLWGATAMMMSELLEVIGELSR